MTGRVAIGMRAIRSLSAPVILARGLRRLGIRGAALDRMDLLNAPDASKPTKAPDILFGAMESVGLSRDPVLAAMEGGTVLEVGCGRHIGFAALSTVGGAETYIGADPSVDESLLRHPAVVKRLLEPALAAASAYVGKPGIDADAMLSRCRLERKGVAAALTDDDRIDVCLSISCLEHIDDISAGAARLAQTSRDGTLHVHLVNFSNHLSKAKPFEHLYEMPPAAFAREWRGIVNGLRPSDLMAGFSEAGLELAFEPLDRVAPSAMPERIDPYWRERYDPEELTIRTGLLFSPSLRD